MAVADDGSANKRIIEQQIWIYEALMSNERSGGRHSFKERAGQIGGRRQTMDDRKEQQTTDEAVLSIMLENRNYKSAPFRFPLFKETGWGEVKNKM